MKFTRKMAEILASKVQELIVREELSSTNEYLKTIISSVHEGIIACNPEGIITCFNVTAEEKLGIEAAPPWDGRFQKSCRNHFLSAALKSQRSIYENSVEYHNAEGTAVHLVSNITLVKKEGRLFGCGRIL